MTPIEVKMSLPSSTSDQREDIIATIETKNSEKVYSIFSNNFNPNTGEIKGLVFQKFGGKPGYRTEVTEEGLFLGIRKFGDEEFYSPYIGIKRKDFKYIQKSDLESTYEEYPSLNLVIGLSDIRRDEGCLEVSTSFDNIDSDVGFNVNLIDFSQVRGNGLNNYHRKRLVYNGERKSLSSMGNSPEHKKHMIILQSVWNINIDDLEIFLSEGKCKEIIEKTEEITNINPTLFAIEEGGVYIGI